MNAQFESSRAPSRFRILADASPVPRQGRRAPTPAAAPRDGRRPAQRLFDMAGSDPVVAMRQYVDPAQEVDAHPASDQKPWQMVEIFWPARRAARQRARKRARPVHQRGNRLLNAVARAFLEAGRPIDEVRHRSDGNTGGSCDIRYGWALALQFAWFRLKRFKR